MSLWARLFGPAPEKRVALLQKAGDIAGLVAMILKSEPGAGLAMEALAKLGHRSAPELLQVLRQHGCDPVDVSGAVLGRSERSTGSPEIVLGSVSELAVRVLGLSGDRRAVPLLRGALGDANLLVRVAAASSLLKLGHQECADLLLGIADAHAKDPTAFFEAMEGLANAGDPRCVMPLLRKLRDYMSVDTVEGIFGFAKNYHNVKRNIATLLRQCGPSATDALIAALGDRDGWTASFAVELIPEMSDGRRAIEQLDALQAKLAAYANSPSEEPFWLTGPEDKSSPRPFWTPLEVRSVSQCIGSALKVLRSTTAAEARTEPPRKLPLP